MDPRTPQGVRLLPDGSLQLFDLVGVIGEIRDGFFAAFPPTPDSSMQQTAEKQQTNGTGAAAGRQAKSKQPQTGRQDRDNDRLNAAEIQPYIERAFCPSRNVRTGAVEINGVALGRAEERAFHQRMAQEGHRYSTQTETLAALDAVAERHSFDPVVRALEDVTETMTRAEIIRWWTEILQLSEPWEAQVWLHWAIGAVEKLYKPGLLLKLCPVLVGGRDLRKSSFVRELAMGFGGTLIVEQNERDRLIALKTQWIWEISEVEQIKKWGWDKAKDFLARPVDHYTPKNSNSAIAQQRNWCLIGTTNSSELVTDPNAASRLPCFTIREVIDTDRVRAEAPAMWAGVRALMHAGMTSHLESGIDDQLAIRQRDHQGENPTRDLIESYLEESRRKEVSLTELARFVLNVDKVGPFDKRMARELQQAMCDLGWVKKPGRHMIPCPFRGHPHRVKATVYARP